MAGRKMALIVKCLAASTIFLYILYSFLLNTNILVIKNTLIPSNKAFRPLKTGPISFKYKCDNFCFNSIEKCGKSLILQFCFFEQMKFDIYHTINFLQYKFSGLIAKLQQLQKKQKSDN
jgi:hypothetical protein